MFRICIGSPLAVISKLYLFIFSLFDHLHHEVAWDVLRVKAMKHHSVNMSCLSMIAFEDDKRCAFVRLPILCDCTIDRRLHRGINLLDAGTNGVRCDRRNGLDRVAKMNLLKIEPFDHELKRHLVCQSSRKDSGIYLRRLA